MDRWKSRGGKSQRREEQKREDQRRERVRRKKMQVREKVAKPRNTVFFQWFVAPEGRKVGSLKRRVRSHVARWEMKNCLPLWREAHFQVKMYKTHHSRTTFGSWDVEKEHAVVAKHVSKSKCIKHTRFGPLLEVEMLKNSTPMWREAHFQVKYKAHQVRSTFWSWDVEKGHAVVARSPFASQKVENTWKHHMFGPLLDVQMSFCVAGARDCAPCQNSTKREGFAAVSIITTTTLHHTTLHSTPLHYTTL